MGEVVWGLMVPSYNGRSFLLKRREVQSGGGGEWKGKHLSLINSPKRLWREAIMTQSKSKLIIKNQMPKPATYSSRIITDIPLYESPQASFDKYLEDKPRVLKAIFPDKRISRRLNEEEWRIQMSPIQFLFMTVFPVIHMRVRCISQGIDYPPGIPLDISKVLELHLITWELQGLQNTLKPSDFTLGVKGYFFSERRGARSRMKGQLEMSMSFVLPPVLSLVPEYFRQEVAQSELKRLVENMKHEVNGSLLTDYSEFKREKLKAKV